MPVSFWSDFRRFFLRGLAAVLPTLLTVMIIVYLFRFVHNYLGVYINAGVIYLLVLVHGEWTDTELWTVWREHMYLQGVGFVLAIVGIYFIGRFVASFIGRFVWRLAEKALMRAPLVKQIYPNVKQVTDFFLSDRKVDFSRVVAVEYPRKGVWSLGLVTGPGMRTVSEATNSDLLTIFVPSSPTPVTGYTVTVRRDEVIDLPLTIDEALRFTVSGGVVVPPGECLPESRSKAPTRAALAGPTHGPSEKPQSEAP